MSSNSQAINHSFVSFLDGNIIINADLLIMIGLAFISVSILIKFCLFLYKHVYRSEESDKFLKVAIIALWLSTIMCLGLFIKMIYDLFV